MKKIVEFLVYSNALLAAGASIVALATILLMEFPFDPIPVFLPFAEVMFIYNLNRMTDTSEDRINVPKRADFVKTWGKFLFGSGVILFIAAISLAILKSYLVFGLILLRVGIAVLYSIFRLKRLYIVKNLLVALAWGLTPALVGFYFNTFDPRILTISLIFAINFFINTVIFDVKDVKGDYFYKIRTLPTVMGIKNTKHICFVINVFSGIILVLSVIYQILPIAALLLIPFMLYIFAYIELCDRKNGLFYGLFVDGEFLLLLIFILLAWIAAVL